MRKFELNGHVPAFYNYRYDQLNRYKGQDGYFNYNAGTNSYGDFTPVNTYKERVNYDANGNIQDYVRYNIHPTGTPMDELSYKYYPGTNKLRQVTDQVPAWQFGTNVWEVPDIDNQDSLNNYKYDSIGNLVRDEAEKNMTIKWSVYGKITEITRNANIADNNTTFRLRYSYDAGGNRIGKERKWYNKDNSRYEISYTWYVRDAQGNLISTYVASTPDTSGANLQDLFVEFTDQQIYGSSRLGSYSVKTNVDDGPIDRYVYTGYAAKFDRGYRQYELSNHLGNVLTTISDKKIGVSSGPVGSLIDYYEPDMVNAQDYFPFGMVSRFNAGNSDQQYRFGFNGKENDNEVKGFANQQDYGMRIYDARLGRFLSVDPLTSKYPSWSPYPFAMNSPIAGVDLDGLEFYYAADGKFLGQGSDPKNMEVRLAKMGKSSIGNDIYTSVDQNGKNSSEWTVVHKNHETFKRFAAMIYEESAGDVITGHTSVDKREPFAIASATVNYVKASKEVGMNYELEDVVKYQGHSSAINKEGFQLYLTTGYKDNWRDANSAAINALLGGVDYSNGAIKWDGFDFADFGKEHSHYSWGLNIDKNHYTNFMSGLESYWGKARYKKKASVLTDEQLKSTTPSVASSAAYARSIFWKYSNDPKAKYSLKDLINHAKQTKARNERLGK